MSTWRKGLLWDKALGGWVVVKTRHKLTPIGLKRRRLKSLPKKPAKPKPAKPKPAKPKPKTRKLKTRKPAKPKPKTRKPKTRKPAKPKAAKRKRKPKKVNWRKGLRWDKENHKWRETTGNKRLLSDRAVGFRQGYLEMEESLRVADDKRDEMFELIKRTLRSAMDGLSSEGYAVDIGRPHKNKDGSIDAVLRVKPTRGKKHQSVREIFVVMEEYLSPIPDAFVSTAVRYHPREDEEFYTKFLGMSQAQAYYQDMSPAKLHFNFASGKVIDEKMRERGRKKAEQVVVLINWNPENERPQTPWQREVQKARKKKGKR